MDKMNIDTLFDLESILPTKCIEEIALAGDNFAACYHWAEQLPFDITKAKAIEILNGYGSWELKELRAMPLCDLKLKMLWIVAWDAYEKKIID